MKLKISEIVVGKRIRKDPGDIEEMAQSIKIFGIKTIPPILVRKLDNNRWKLLAGWRRLQAFQLAGLTTIEAKRIEE